MGLTFGSASFLLFQIVGGEYLKIFILIF